MFIELQPHEKFSDLYYIIATFEQSNACVVITCRHTEDDTTLTTLLNFIYSSIFPVYVFEIEDSERTLNVNINWLCNFKLGTHIIKDVPMFCYETYFDPQDNYVTFLNYYDKKDREEKEQNPTNFFSETSLFTFGRKWYQILVVKFNR